MSSQSLSDPVTAALSLAPDPQAPGRARRFVADQLSAAGNDVLAEVGQLLVSELVTNAVVHAASAVVVELTQDDDSIVIRVRDADTGPLVGRAGGGTELDEGGRGFMLVDRLADAWGTEHHGGRKTVWFRLLREGRESPVAPPPTPLTEPADISSALEYSHRLLRTLVLRPSAESALSFSEQLGELVARVVDVVEGRGAALALPGETSPIVTCGELAAGKTHTYELVLDDRRLGDLTVCIDGELDDEDDAFLRLAADRLALLAVEHGVLRSEQSRAADHDFLSEATELLAGSTSVGLSLTLLTQIAVPRLADWCAAFAVDERGRPRRLTANHRREDRADAVLAVLDTDRELRQAIMSAAAGGPPQRLSATVSVGGQRSHVVVLPLATRFRTLGVLALGGPEPLDAITFVAAVELARRAALAVDNARLHEEQAATVLALQASLLPSALPAVEGVDLAARYHSASPGMSVGGDFYDAVPLADGSVVLTIGDVCGKGAEAAAVTGMSRDLLRVFVEDGLEPCAALRRLNRALLDHPSTSRFCTVALTHLRRTGDDLVASICLAGHPEPVVLRADGTTELVGEPGDLLGVLDDDEMELAEATVKLGIGDALVLYTDGITERRDGRRMFGQYGLRKTLTQSAGADAEALANAVEEAAESFVDTELRDDLAILVMRRVV